MTLLLRGPQVLGPAAQDVLAAVAGEPDHDVLRAAADRAQLLDRPLAQALDVHPALDGPAVDHGGESCARARDGGQPRRIRRPTAAISSSVMLGLAVALGAR